MAARPLNDGRVEVAVTARVMAVERSKAGLKKGGTISIRYETYDQGTPPPGPRQVPVLKKGEFYPAFLNAAGRDYSPAAYGESFRMSPEL